MLYAAIEFSVASRVTSVSVLPESSVAVMPAPAKFMLARLVRSVPSSLTRSYPTPSPVMVCQVLSPLRNLAAVAPEPSLKTSIVPELISVASMLLLVSVWVPEVVTTSTPPAWTAPVPLGMRFRLIFRSVPVAESEGAAPAMALVRVTWLAAEATPTPFKKPVLLVESFNWSILGVVRVLLVRV